MLHVCSLAALPDTVKITGASHVLTVMANVEQVQRPVSVLPANHLKVSMDDITEIMDGFVAPCEQHIEKVLLLTAFTNVGLSGCEMGVSFFLPRIVGMGVATELMYTSRAVDAERALRIGLVSEVVAADTLEDAGRRMAADMLRATPLGLRRTKEIFNLSQGLTDLKAVLKIEGDTQSKLARLYQDQLKSSSKRLERGGG